MEPRALASANNPTFRNTKGRHSNDPEIPQKALFELSTKGKHRP